MSQENFCRVVFRLLEKSNVTQSISKQMEAVAVTKNLIGIDRQLTRIAERECSVQMERPEEIRQEKKEERLEAKARTIAEKWGLEFYRQGDCRGCAVYLYNPAELPANTSIGSMYSSIGIAFCE